MSPFELDINEHRVALLGYTQVVLSDGTPLEVDQLRLDTGLAVPLLAPERVVREHGGRLLPHHQPLTTFTGTCRTWLSDATLRIGDAFAERVELWVVPMPDDTHWYVGLPLLRRFHLLLAPDPRGMSWLTRP